MILAATVPGLLALLYFGAMLEAVSLRDFDWLIASAIRACGLFFITAVPLVFLNSVGRSSKTISIAVCIVAALQACLSVWIVWYMFTTVSWGGKHLPDFVSKLFFLLLALGVVLHAVICLATTVRL